MKRSLPFSLFMMLYIFAFGTASTSANMDRTASISSLKHAINFAIPNANLSSNREISIETPRTTEPNAARSNDIQRVRIQFSAEDGLIRPLLLGFTPDNAATDGFDYGYDALAPDHYPNDMFWDIAANDYVIQGVGAFDATKVYPLNMNITNPGSISIALTDLENFESDIDVFVYDNKLNTYTQINGTNFTITLNEGTFDNRFFIAFQTVSALSIADSENTSLTLKYLNASSEIYIKSSASVAVEQVQLLNMMGQSILIFNKQHFKTIDGETRIPLAVVSQGTYILKVGIENAFITKTILIKN